MAKKKGRGRPKGSGRGPTSNLDLRKRIGAAGLRQVQEIQRKYSQDVVLMASRSFPKLPSGTEKLLRELPDGKAKEIRAELLKVI